MNEQLLKDFIATAQKYNYDWNKTFGLFPELSGYDQQLLKDYVATAEKDNYDYSIINPKFPELGFVKKKDEVAPSAQPKEEAQPMAQAQKGTESVLGVSSSALPSDEEAKRRGITFLTPEYGKKVAEEAKVGVYMGSQFQQPVEPVVPIPSAAPSKSEADFSSSLEEVNKDLMDYDEDYIVPKLNYLFGKDKYGFEFKEARAGREAVEVIAPNGNKIVIPVDAWTEKGDIESSEAFKKFLNENKPKLAKLSDEYNIYQSQIRNEQDMKNVTESINSEVMQLNDLQKQLVLENSNLNKEFNYLNSIPQNQRGTDEYIKRLDEYNKRRDSLNANIQSASQLEKDIAKKQNQAGASIGRYTAMRAEQGGWFGGLYNSLLGGYSGMGAAATGILTDVIMSLPLEMTTSPKDIQETFTTIAASKGISVPDGMSYEEFKSWSNSIDKETRSDITSEVKDYLTKRTKGEMLPSIRKGLVEKIGDISTTPEYMADANIVTRGLYGLAGSLPAMSFAGGGAAATTGAFFLQGYDAIMKEMESDEFKDISENEKYLVALPVGITVAVLENFGMRNVLSKSGVVNNIVSKALSKSSSTTTAKTFRELVENEVESSIAKGVLVLTGAGLAEAETGAAQQAAEIGIKEIYNAVKGKDMFDTPDTVGELAKEIAIAGIEEAIGGFAMGSFNAISTAYGENNFNGVTDETLSFFNKMANDENIRNAYAVNLKSRVVSGEITAEQAKTALDNINNSISVYNSIPDGLAPAQQRQAFSLLRERKRLESEISGKDEAMVKKQKVRIAEINEELAKVSEAKEAAPSEAKPEEIPQEIASLADDEVVTMRVKTLDEIPEGFRDRAEKVEGTDVEVRETILGLPIGKKTTQRIGDGFRYTLTGKEAKDYAIQKQAAGQVPVQPTARVGKEVEERAPEAKPEEAAQAGVEEEVSRMEEMFGEAEQVQEPSPKAQEIEEERQLMILEDKVSLAKREISRAEDTQAAIEEYNKVKKEKEDFEAKIEERKQREKSSKNVELLLEDEAENSQKAFYEYKELYDKDPRLAAIQSAKDMIEFLESGDYENNLIKTGESPEAAKKDAKRSIERTKKDLADLEADIKARPTVSSKTQGVSVSNKAQITQLESKTTDTNKKKIIRAATTAINTLKSVFPDMDIVMHESEGSYDAQMGRVNGRTGSAGNFAVTRNAQGKIVGGRIDINLSRANMRTVAHEVAHAVMLKAFGDDPALFKVFRDRISKILSDSTVEKLNDFAGQYSESESHEEFLVELSAALTENEQQLTPVVVNKIAELINKVVSKITGGLIQPFSGKIQTRELVDFMNAMSSAIRKGEAIEVVESKTKSVSGTLSKAQLTPTDTDVESNPVYFNNLKTFASNSSFANKIQFKKSVQDLLISYLPKLKEKYGKSFDPKKNDELTKKYLSDIITTESVNAISAHPEAIGWYDEKTSSALDVISAIHPEIATDNEARGAFILPLAVMSNGNLVDFNFLLAEKQYDYFKKNGRFNPNGEFGLQQSGIKKSLMLVNSLLDNGLSMSDINNFLTSKYRAGDLKVKINGKIKNLASGELADELVYGATILGPKIGNGFYMNLWGQFDQLTMDRWFMRTWGRLTGTLLNIDSKAISDGKKRVSSALNEIKSDPTSLSILKSVIGKLSGVSVTDLAKSIEKASMDKNSRSILASNPKTDELRKASNQLSKNISGEKEAPANGNERKFIRDVFADVRNRLKTEHNIDISMADLQAVLWYPEKILYESFKGGKTFEEASEGYTSDSAPDYFNAAKKLAKKLQVDETKINEALSRGRERAQRGIGTGNTAGGESVVGANKEILERVTKTIGEPSTASTSKTKVTETTTVSKSQMTATPKGTPTMLGNNVFYFGSKPLEARYGKDRGLQVFFSGRWYRVKWSDFTISRTPPAGTTTVSKAQVAEVAKSLDALSEGEINKIKEVFVSSANVNRVVDIAERFLDEIGEGYIDGVYLIGSRAKGRGFDGDFDFLVVGEGFDAVEQDKIDRLEAGEKIYGLSIDVAVGKRKGSNDIIFSSNPPKGQPSILVYGSGLDSNKSISEAYLQAKQDGSNPELVKAVEDVIGEPTVSKAQVAEEVKEMDKTFTVSKSQKASNEIKKVIRDARAQGFSEQAIKVFLTNRGFTRQEAESLVKEVVEASTKIELNEQTMAGYDRMMEQVDEIILKGMQRRTPQEKIMENILSYVEGSKAYQDATDIQREELVREIKKAFGEKMKSAPSAGRLLGMPDPKKITISEKELLKIRLSSMAAAAKNVKRLLTITSQQLTKELREMRGKGSITINQATAVLNAFSKVDMLNPTSVSNFVDYMARVFKDAEYAEKISKIRKQIKTAKRNIHTKLGVSKGLVPQLEIMLSVNPNMVPESVFNTYAEIVNMIGEKAKVLKLEEVTSLMDKVDDVLNAIAQEQSVSAEMYERYINYADKVIKNGEVDFAATLKKMVDDGTMTDAEAEILRKYKSTFIAPTGKKAKTEQELADEKADMIKVIKGAVTDPSNLPLLDERKRAEHLIKMSKTDAIDSLDNMQLKHLLGILDNINNGYFPHAGEMLTEALDSIANSKQLANAQTKAKPLIGSQVYSKIKGLIVKGKPLTEMIRRNPLFFIDQVFGDFNTRDIFNSLFAKVAEAHTMFSSSLKQIENRLDNAYMKVLESHGGDTNKALEASYRMTAYMIQKEYESNAGSKQVNSAADYLKATIKKIDSGKTYFREKDAEMLQNILDNFTTDGNIDLDKLHRSFNLAERNALRIFREINDGLTPKAMYTSAVIRGERIKPLNNYVHLQVMPDHRPDNNVVNEAEALDYSDRLNPSTKAKNLVGRTGAVKPINFDIFSTVHRGAKFTLLDYYMTPPVRTARQTLSRTKEMLRDENGRIADKKTRDVNNAIEDAFEEALSNVLVNNFSTNSLADEAIQYMSKTGYRAVLAGIPRFASELASNTAFALIADPASFAKGFEMRGFIMSALAADAMMNLNSKQTTRIFPTDMLSGRMVDTQLFSQASGAGKGRAHGDITNKLIIVYNNSLKKVKNVVELTADTLISTPDKMVIRPMWFGSFAKTFKEITGMEPDMEKIAANDEAYMKEHEVALGKARDVADEKTTLTASTDNPFMGLLKGAAKPNQSALTKAFNMFNNYMTRFLIYEYMTARQGLMAAMGNGYISRKQGAAMLGAVTTRMISYGFLMNVLTSAMVGLFVDDEDEDDDKTLGQKFGQAVASGLTGLVIGRDFGNATKTILNYGVEKANQEYLDELRNGEYDPFKDAISYTVLPTTEEQQAKTGFFDLIAKMSGPFSPAIATANLAWKTFTGKEKKEKEAIERQEKVKAIRIPLEVLGNLGYIPLYKDVRKIVMAELYSELDKAEKQSAKDKAQKELDKPPFGLTMEQYKRYYPAEYEKKYGEGSDYRKRKEAEGKIEKEKEELKRKMMDDFYNYQPKSKNGFGSKKFGEKKFGGKGFGEKD